MNRIQKLTLGLVVLAALIPALAQTKATPAKGRKPAAMRVPSSSAQIARGQMVFDQNCSRCHSAPQSFPPQISGTILRHMKVRASLSAADEKALLRFMNP